MAEINPTDPTQTSFPWRTALRTALQTFLAVLAVLVAVAPLVAEFVEQFWPGSPVSAWIVGAAGFAAALAALITRIMALEAVNALLTRFGLGATPK